jgi:hypothetical protein
LLCHFVLSRGLGLYKTFPPLDIPVHLAGGLAVAYFVTRAFAAIPEGAVARPHRALLCGVLAVSVTATGAVCWEFAEFLSDRYLWTRAQRGLQDTLGDVAMGMLGACAWVGIAHWRGALARVDPLGGR